MSRSQLFCLDQFAQLQVVIVLLNDLVGLFSVWYPCLVLFVELYLLDSLQN